MSNPYRPSNGSEGDYFMADWCARCTKDTVAVPCPILGASFCYQIGDPLYPPEWIVDDDGLSNARCTAFEEKR